MRPSQDPNPTCPPVVADHNSPLRCRCPCCEANRQALLEPHRQGLSQRHAMLRAIPAHIADLESRDRKARRQRRGHIRQYRHKLAVAAPSTPRLGSDTKFSAERRSLVAQGSHGQRSLHLNSTPVAALPCLIYPFYPFLVSDHDRPLCHPWLHDPWLLHTGASCDVHGELRVVDRDCPSLTASPLPLPHRVLAAPPHGICPISPRLRSRARRRARRRAEGFSLRG